MRIFPYLIGRESAFADNLKWMACANKGLGLFDKHFMKTALCQNVEYDIMWCFCEEEDVCGLAVFVYIMCFCVHAWVCTGSDSF